MFHSKLAVALVLGLIPLVSWALSSFLLVSSPPKGMIWGSTDCTAIPCYGAKGGNSPAMHFEIFRWQRARTVPSPSKKCRLEGFALQNPPALKASCPSCQNGAGGGGRGGELELWQNKQKWVGGGWWKCLVFLFPDHWDREEDLFCWKAPAGAQGSFSQIALCYRAMFWRPGSWAYTARDSADLKTPECLAVPWPTFVEMGRRTLRCRELLKAAQKQSRTGPCAAGTQWPKGKFFWLLI